MATSSKSSNKGPQIIAEAILTGTTSSYLVENPFLSHLKQIFKADSKKSLSPEILDSLSSFVPPATPYLTEKFSEISAYLRNYGNNLYSSSTANHAPLSPKNIPLLLHTYTLSLLFAPPKSPLYSLSFANRSAVLMQMEEYQLALRDLNYALNNFPPSAEVPEKVKKTLLKRKEKIEKILSNSSQDYFKSKLQQGEDFFKDLETVFEFDNSYLKGGSEKVRLDFEKDKGRKLVALENIDAGTPLLSNPHITLIPSSILKFQTQHCAQCGTFTLAGIPDPESVFVIFCSANCLEKRNQDFMSLLPFLHAINADSLTLLIVRLLVETGQEKLEEYFNSRKSGQKNSINPTYDSMTYESVHSLISHYNHSDPTPKLMSAYLSHLLTSTIFPTNSANFSSDLAQSIYDHYHALPFNIISLSHWTLPALHNSPLSHPFYRNIAQKEGLETSTITYATGIYTLVALVNHSCDPNSMFLKHPKLDKAFLIATRNVKKGDELFISYYKPFTKAKYEDRFNYLKENYCFECECGACKEKLGPEDLENVDTKEGDEALKKILLRLTCVKEMQKRGNYVGAWKDVVKMLKEGFSEKRLTTRKDRLVFQEAQECVRTIGVWLCCL